MSIDYKNTVFLPKTDFPMRGGLAQKEPELLAFWQRIDLYGKMREKANGKPSFILHDGPPYANGNIHIGHALNKVLKDVINRCQYMLGRDVHYVPGWDCHGLPIEWKIEEKYRKAGKDKDQVPVLQFREECREFAASWKAIQAQEFQRLGVLGDWHNPYYTMDFKAEANIVREIHKFAMHGGLYRDVKPVMWSTVEKTALADAEVEYHDVVSTACYVKFPVIGGSLKGAAVVIWTTTPWTLPANRALAYGEKIDYVLVAVTAVDEKASVNPGEKLVLAAALLENVAKQAGIVGHTILQTIRGADLQKTLCAHPLHGQGYKHEVPLLAADFVTTEQGTGFVHIAPSHGEDDYHLGRQHKLEIPDLLDDAGVFRDGVPLFAGKRIYTAEGKGGDANGAVFAALKEVAALLATHKITHSYPHSWRSKAPVIFRTTPQWFISMETNGLRQKALAAIRETQWFPRIGQVRILSMVESRPDWCISRQRSWGVPIAIFVHKKDGEILRDNAVNERIAKAFESEGADAWFACPARDFLGANYNPADYHQVFDIVDVWFESGSTHAFVLEARGMPWPADLYLEGSDQHRGWFQSSLLEACGTRGVAPFKAVLTHGFVLDEQGRKMSKSLGNVVAPQEVTEQMGADILRLWILGSDTSNDVRIGKEILKQAADSYRRLRNTLRYLLGALDGFSEAERVAENEMPELEQWVLNCLYDVSKRFEYSISIDSLNFNWALNVLRSFCIVDLSAFYFDIRKDSLYCDSAANNTRRAARTVMWEVYRRLVTWLAPILCFTTEEAWQQLPASSEVSVHLQEFIKAPESWRQDVPFVQKWDTIRSIRETVLGALEQARADKKIGASLQAAPIVRVKDQATAALLHSIPFADICITSAITIEIDPGSDTVVAVGLAKGQKCDRCWRVLEEVGRHAKHKLLCARCVAVVD